MTDAQIEAIARAYCKRLGLDPDFVPPDRPGDWPRWKFHVEAVGRAMLPSAIAMRAAIAEVLGNTEGRG